MIKHTILTLGAVLLLNTAAFAQDVSSTHQTITSQHNTAAVVKTMVRGR